MIHTAEPPILLRNMIADPGGVVRLLERNAPYSPIGGWYRPGVDEEVAASAMWFQKAWVHADLAVEGSDLFQQNALYHEPRGSSATPK